MPASPTPRVVLVHPHLRPGGVTSVILSQAAAFRERNLPHLLLSGSPSAPSDSPHHSIHGMDYHVPPLAEEHELASQWLAAAARILGPGPLVWHFHNPFLGRSIPYARAVLHLARAGLPCVFHLHDFAEDGRPACLKALRPLRHLYPLAPRLLTVVINSRDRRLLLEAGHPPHSLSLVDHPLTLSLLPAAPPISSPSPLLLYPVRGLRRKNLGECLLWTIISPVKWTLAVSRPPDADADLAVYHHWLRESARHDLPVIFGATGRVAPPGTTDSSFASWQARSTHWISTSIAEGFGLAFLEAAAARKPLIARRIPALAPDLVRWKLDSPAFYDALTVPSSWLDAPVSFDRLDFAALTLEQQTAVLDLLIRQPQAADRIQVRSGTTEQTAAAWLTSALLTHPPAAPDLSAFHPAAHAERLTALYHQLLSAPRTPLQWLDRRRLAGLFASLDPTPPLLR